MANTSRQPGVNTSIPTPTQISGMTANGDLLSAQDTLRSYAEEILHTDKRFVGMSRYVFNINFYWSMAIPTACAGAGFIFFNPIFWDGLEHEKKKTVLAHEIWHLILNHLERGKDLDPDSYNIAGDHVINLTLKEDGFMMAEGMDFNGVTPCCDPKYVGMSTEQVYALIHKKRKKDPFSCGKAQGPSTSEIEDLIKQAIEGTGKDLAQVKEQDAQAREEAIEAGKEPGKNPGGTHRLLVAASQKVFIQNATYQEIFEDYLTDPLSGGKRTFMRPSRRQIKGDGLRLKGKYPKRGRKNRLTHLVYALDVSGSITQHQARQFISSAKTLKETLNPVSMTVMLWDTAVRFEKTYREDEKLDNIKVIAGGGTQLEPVYQRVRQINPEALVIFTDLCVTIPPKPDWETIWFVPNEHIHESYLQQVTYGTVYRIPEK